MNERSADERIAALRAARSEGRRRFPAQRSRVGVTVAAAVGFTALIPVMGPLTSSAVSPDDQPSPEPLPTSPTTRVGDDAPTDTVDSTIALSEPDALVTESTEPESTSVPTSSALEDNPAVVPTQPPTAPASPPPPRAPAPAPAPAPVAPAPVAPAPTAPAAPVPPTATAPPAPVATTPPPAPTTVAPPPTTAAPAPTTVPPPPTTSPS